MKNQPTKPIQNDILAGLPDMQALEAHVLAGMLEYGDREPGFADDLMDLCPRGSFRNAEYAEIWDIMSGLHGLGQEINQVTVFEQLAERNRQGRYQAWVGKPDAQLLAELSGQLVTRRSALDCAEKLGGVCRKGRIHGILLETLADLQGITTEPETVVEVLRRKLDNMTEPQSGDQTLGPLLDKVLADVMAGAGARPIPTPWHNLNWVLKGGAAPGELVVLAGRPGLGKTAMAGCWGVETAKNVGPVLFVSCEVKDQTLGARLLAREGRIDNRAFRQGLGNNGGDLDRMRRARNELSQVPMRIVDSSSRMVRPGEVRKLARKIPGRPALVVVDYLQLMYPDTQHQSREREIAEMSRSMKRLAVELDCPVLLLSQLNRKTEESGRAPQLADLRESGAIEQDADIVIMLHSERNHLGLERCPVKALVRKGRSSGTGDAYMIFDKTHSDFVTDERGEAWRKQHQPQAVADNGL